MNETIKRSRTGYVMKSKKRRIDQEAFRAEIEKKYKNLGRASQAAGRSHDFLNKVFRVYNIEFPEAYLYEIREKLGIDFTPFLKKNTPRYNDNQITFEEFVRISDEADEKEVIEFFDEVEKQKVGMPVEHKEKYVRFCTAVPASTREKMNMAAFELSSPGHIVSMSELLIIWANEYEKRRENS